MSTTISLEEAQAHLPELVSNLTPGGGNYYHTESAARGQDNWTRQHHGAEAQATGQRQRQIDHPQG